MLQTTLFGEYAKHQAKVVDFHGWALPVQFAGIIIEHQHTRAAAGLFDCSHMGEFILKGEAAIAHFDSLVCSDMLSLKVGRCRYTALLNEEAGVIDDCVGLRLAEDEYYVVTNAGPLEEVSPLLCGGVDGAADVTEATTKIDLQGPKSRDILLELGLGDIAPLGYWTGLRTSWAGEEIIVTRAGYTGELGYELFAPNGIGPKLWQTLVAHPDVQPCGLGARDTLRLEVGYPLNGEDLAADKTPLESGMERFIAWGSNFPGKEALQKQKESGGYTVLAAIQSADRRAPRHGFEIKLDGEVIGKVTSGTFGPSVGLGIGLADLPPEHATPGVKLTAGPKDMPIETAEIPIYKNGTCRLKF